MEIRAGAAFGSVGVGAAAGFISAGIHHQNRNPGVNLAEDFLNNPGAYEIPLYVFAGTSVFLYVLFRLLESGIDSDRKE